MADRSAIEWTDATWNPLRGCTRVSAGCQHCYAEGVAARFSGPGLPYEGLIHPNTRGWNGKIRLVPEVLPAPLGWKKPRRVFVNSMSDLFHESVPDSYIAAVFAVMAATPQHTYQILTKRPERMLVWLTVWMKDSAYPKMHEGLKGAIGYHHPRRPAITNGPWPLANVWLGVSVENQSTADERIPLLLKCPAAVRWLSCEPLLGPLDLQRMHLIPHNAPVNALAPGGCVQHAPGHCLGACEWRWPGIDWVVAGGESGTGARPMHPDWALSVRDQCAAAAVPFFFKQWGEWVPMMGHSEGIAVNRSKHVFPDGTVVGRAGKRNTGRQLQGVEHSDYPAPRGET